MNFREGVEVEMIEAGGCHAAERSKLAHPQVWHARVQPQSKVHQNAL